MNDLKQALRTVLVTQFRVSRDSLDDNTALFSSGLIAGGMWRVVTDLAVMDFDEKNRAMRVLALHPGVTPEQVRDNTGFDIGIESRVERTAPPHENELSVVRNLDPERLYTA